MNSGHRSSQKDDLTPQQIEAWWLAHEPRYVTRGRELFVLGFVLFLAYLVVATWLHWLGIEIWR